MLPSPTDVARSRATVTGPSPSRRVLLGVLLVLAVVPYFIGLGDSSIWDANEAFYVETPREMMERGDYVEPTFNYEPRLNKPVLSYWIVAGFYRVFGVSVGVQRLPIALGALGLIAAAWALAAFGRRPDDPPAVRLAPLWAALGLAAAPRLLMFARRIFIDIYISLFMALTLVAFAASERDPTRRGRWLTLMYVLVGLGVLTKGPIAALLPGLVFLVYLAVNRELGRVREMRMVSGILIVLTIVVPWYALLYQRDGWTAITSFFVGENVDRFTTGAGVQVERAPWFYLPVILTDSFPISLLLIPAAVIAWRTRSGVLDAGARVRRLLWIWILVIVGFFSLSAAKQDLYIFPVVPAVAALGALVLTAVQDTSGAPGFGIVRATVAAAGGVLALLGVGLIGLFMTSSSTYALAGVLAIAVSAIAGGVATTALAARRRLFEAMTALAGAFVVLSWVFVLATLPSFEKYKPVPAFAGVLARHAGPADVIGTYDQALPSLVYYLRRHVREVFEEPDLVDLLASGKGAYVILSAGDFDRLQPSLPAGTCVLARQPTFDVKLKNVLAREPLPELLLITNRCGTNQPPG